MPDPTPTPTPDPTPTPTPTPPAVNWFDGADPEIIGHLQAHGWDRKDAKTAALEAVQSYRKAQQLLGAPPDQLLRFPKPEDEDGWKKVYEKLGVPNDPKEYDFAAVKFADGTPLDEDFAGFIRGEAQKLHLNKTDALAFASDLVKRFEAEESSDKAEKTASLAQEKAKLQANWGVNFEANQFVSKQAAQKLGVTPEQIAALEGVVGYASVMEMFRGLGVKMGEDKFVLGGPNGNSGIMSVDEAKAKRTDLMQDVAWKTKYLNGDGAAKREMLALNTIIAGH